MYNEMNNKEYQLEKIGHKLADAYNKEEFERHNLLMAKLFKSSLNTKGINFVMRIYRNAIDN